MMIERRALRCTASFGLASVALRLVHLEVVGVTRILLDQGLSVAMLLFAIGLRHLVVQTRPERESAGTFVVAAMVLWLAVTPFALAATFLGAAAYATFVTRVLPRWSAWMAAIAAALSVAFVTAPTSRALAGAPAFVWVLAVSAWMLRRSIAKPRPRDERVMPVRLGRLTSASDAALR